MNVLDPSAIRAALQDSPDVRPRDLAASLGLSEGQLVAATVGQTAERIDAQPDQLMPKLCGLGDVMALTRNESAVHERTGSYDEWHPGSHAAMILGPEIDLRIFPQHWVHGFAIRRPAGDNGPTRSIQVFDATGLAVHKVYPRAGTDLEAWDRMIDALSLGDVSDRLDVAPAPAPEGARSQPAKADALREEWRRMTDTHQFLRLVSKLKMNRLGAYRIAGSPFARPLAPDAVNSALVQVAEAGAPIMLFVGNQGCIQIHSGTIETLKPMGPWQNVLDPRFNLHLRKDRIAEAWLVQKPTKRGMALSVEAFDGDGELILQVFGLRKSDADYSAAFANIAETLPIAEVAV
ncbi:MAG: ChuX/HutX family heme-like substrate-binding protein [Pseudomonadota bacterium]